MNHFPSPQLKEPYQSYLEQGKWDEYISALCDEGLVWWFNMEILSIATHLVPLSALPQGSLPRRLLFMSEAVKAAIPTESIERFYQAFLKENDLEAAFAAAGAGMASIWDSGQDFNRFDVWYERANQLLKKGKRVSALAQASLLGFKGMVEIAYWGKLDKAVMTFDEQLSWAERANSSSLRVFRASALGYCLTHTGDLAKLEMIFFDTAPLCNLPETSLICKFYYQIASGLFCTVQGKVFKGRQILQEVVNHPLFEWLPSSLWLLGHGNLLLASSFLGDIEGVKAISHKIQQRAVPEQNHFHQAYAHYNMGIASLVIGRPHKALLYSREAMERARKSDSPIYERLAALLIGQALSDLGETQEALKHLSRWMDKWEESGLYALAVAGALEISCLLMKKGRVEEARKYYEQASNLLPKGEKFLNLYRPPEFIEKLKSSLYPVPSEITDWATPDRAVVRIETFGELRVQIGKKILYDRNWRGSRTKGLLKALIVYGGTKVSTDLILDALWPDTDGDLATKNLKVALTRLRRTGCQTGEEPLPWVMVRHRHISLSKVLCSVDSIFFKERLSAVLKSEDSPDLLVKTLDLYKDDFLIHDSESWIISHREVLRDDFIKGVRTLFEMSKKTGKIEEALPYLQKAIDKDPLQENLYVLLMRAYIEMGYPSSALKVFQRAKETLREELGIEPGPALLALARQASGKK